LGLTWHLVGHLQRNKARQALELFTLIHSVDSLRLAETLDREAAKLGLLASVLIQVNASGEDSKYGFDIESALSAVRAISELDHIRVDGLMTMAPLTGDAALLRRTFRKTRELYERCREDVVKFEGRHLSMGMSNDFEIAVEEGSTMVRLGTMVFGERPS
jgi:pyridoxal phosphate enzyme (YggS family)